MSVLKPTTYNPFGFQFYRATSVLMYVILYIFRAVVLRMQVYLLLCSSW